MKPVVVTSLIIFLCPLLVGSGCELSPAPVELPPNADNDFADNVSNEVSVCTLYAPVKMDIMPLTEFVTVDNTRQVSKIKIYVSLLDSFDCQIKTPGIFRFELYKYVQRSAEPKGKRIVIWPDIDLTEPSENNDRWRDFLRAYEFNLDLEFQSSKSYILQVTCLCPDDKRLSADFTLEAAK